MLPCYGFSDLEDDTYYIDGYAMDFAMIYGII